MPSRKTPQELAEEKVALWKVAYDAIAAELSPQLLRDQFQEVIHGPLPQDENALITFTARMNASLGLGRLLSANDRAAGTIAALLVGQGIKLASVDYGDDT